MSTDGKRKTKMVTKFGHKLLHVFGHRHRYISYLLREEEANVLVCDDNKKKYQLFPSFASIGYKRAETSESVTHTCDQDGTQAKIFLKEISMSAMFVPLSSCTGIRNSYVGHKKIMEIVGTYLLPTVVKRLLGVTEENILNSLC